MLLHSTFLFGITIDKSIHGAIISVLKERGQKQMKEISKEERDIIASNIIKLCKERGIKYTFIANKLGIKKQVFDKILHGTRHISPWCQDQYEDKLDG